MTIVPHIVRNAVAPMMTVRSADLTRKTAALFGDAIKGVRIFLPAPYSLPAHRAPSATIRTQPNPAISNPWYSTGIGSEEKSRGSSAGRSAPDAALVHAIGQATRMVAGARSSVIRVVKRFVTSEARRLRGVTEYPPIPHRSTDGRRALRSRRRRRFRARGIQPSHRRAYPAPPLDLV